MANLVGLVVVILGRSIVSISKKRPKKLHGESTRCSLWSATATCSGVLRFAKYIVADLSELNSFMQQYGVSPERFGEYKELCSFFKVLTTSADSDNKVYVSTVHAHNYPVTAFQWHPEEISALRWNRSGEKIP
ncbi:probable gamma-glutamyl hydrolase 3 isoform X1 [Camellia sinensis]|uniref:Glutamine amidotransferase domain-containing protein n=1 Tax=Camellia sinensis var. sinensis TaxID=542762 RepID=A0A4V3WLY3_CAMSN|nr:probable gamma-glutamyl hydrolase 3 isoform X1 [Camellia sinensis]THG06467.1 hypothetical protein TEA_029111 [Camellia sinensis var. sinensis]